MLRTLAPVFEGRKPDVTEENIQARLRGLTLMSLSNKFGAMVLTTGNKSEIAVGYCTLYGDMCGGLAVISDVPKTMVYALSRDRQLPAQRRDPGIGFRESRRRRSCGRIRRTATRCRPTTFWTAFSGSTSRRITASARSPRNLALPVELVRDVVRKVDRNEYKRQQAAPGLKVTSKAFGMGRRLPD